MRLMEQHIWSIIGYCMSISYQLFIDDDDIITIKREGEDIRIEQLVNDKVVLVLYLTSDKCSLNINTDDHPPLSFDFILFESNVKEYIVQNFALYIAQHLLPHPSTQIPVTKWEIEDCKVAEDGSEYQVVFAIKPGIFVELKYDEDLGGWYWEK